MPSTLAAALPPKCGCSTRRWAGSGRHRSSLGGPVPRQGGDRHSQGSWPQPVGALYAAVGAGVRPMPLPVCVTAGEGAVHRAVLRRDGASDSPGTHGPGAAGRDRCGLWGAFVMHADRTTSLVSAYVKMFVQVNPGMPGERPLSCKQGVGGSSPPASSRSVAVQGISREPRLLAHLSGLQVSDPCSAAADLRRYGRERLAECFAPCPGSGWGWSFAAEPDCREAGGTSYSWHGARCEGFGDRGPVRVVDRSAGGCDGVRLWRARCHGANDGGRFDAGSGVRRRCRALREPAT